MLCSGILRQLFDRETPVLALEFGAVRLIFNSIRKAGKEMGRHGGRPSHKMPASQRYGPASPDPLERSLRNAAPTGARQPPLHMPAFAQCVAGGVAEGMALRKA